jgi:hypothetical protein
MCQLPGRDSTLPVDFRHRFGEAGSQRIVIEDRMVLDDASTDWCVSGEQCSNFATRCEGSAVNRKVTELGGRCSNGGVLWRWGGWLWFH